MGILLDSTFGLWAVFLNRPALVLLCRTGLIGVGVL
jgi:hypothetical protein